MIPHLRSFRTLAILAMFATLPGCMKSDNDNPTGTEVENEVVGLIYLAEGKPAAGAKVRLFPVGWSSKPGAEGTGEPYVAVTNAKGEYRLDSLQTGEYNVLAGLDGLASYRDSVIVARSTRTLPSDTLDAPGSILGFVVLQPNHLPSTATVEILGTNFFTNVGGTGKFVFQGLAAGDYSIRVSSTEDQYTSLYSGFTIRVGREDTLSDTLRLPFNGIPVVTGLKVDYDTLNGVARITWNPADYPLLQGYSLFRDTSGYEQLSANPLIRLADTVYLDRLFSPNLSQDEDLRREDRIYEFEYRIKARNKSDDPGPNFGYVSLSAPSPARVRTFLDLHAPGMPDLILSPNDTATITVDYRNPGRENDSLFWFQGSSGSPARIKTGLGMSGSDAFLFAAADAPGDVPVEVIVKDAAGSRWESRLSIRIVEDKPSAYAGRDTIASVSSSFALKGKASQRFGTVAKWEWDIGGTGVFARTSGPDTTFTLPAAYIAGFPCILKVTDDDGYSDLDTMTVIVSNSQPLYVQEKAASSATHNGRIYFFGGLNIGGYGALDNRVVEFDTATKTVRERMPMPSSRKRSAAITYKNKIYLIGGTGPFVYFNDIGNEISKVDIFDPHANSWGISSPMINPIHHPSAVVIEDKFYVVGKMRDQTMCIQEYDVNMDSWKVLITFPTPGFDRWNPDRGGSAAVLDGRIYILGTGLFVVFDPVAVEVKSAGAAHLHEFPGPLIAYNGKLFDFGGMTGNTLSNEVRQFDPATNAWSVVFRMNRTRFMPQVQLLGSRAFVMGGYCSPAPNGTLLDMDYGFCPDSEAIPLP